MTDTSEFQRRQIALEQGVRWAVNAGQNGGKGDYTDAVKAAEAFASFLDGGDAQPEAESAS